MNLDEELAEIDDDYGYEELDRRRMLAIVVNALFGDVPEPLRPFAALAWAHRMVGLQVRTCWAGRCMYYLEPDGKIASAVVMTSCPCGARNARSYDELPKRPFPRKGKR